MTVRLYVGNLGPHTTESQLARFFSSAGMEVVVRIPADLETGGSPGFGFVEFTTEEQARRALTVFNGRRLGRHQLRLERADGPADESRPQHSPPRDSEEERRHQDDDDSGRGQRRRQDGGRDGGSRKRRRGKHGSDRIRRRGTRRVIE